MKLDKAFFNSLLLEADFAQWAPREGEPNVADFLAWIADAQTGEKYEN